MTEHVHLRVRTQDGLTAIVNPTEEDDFDIEVVGQVYGLEISDEMEERALDLLLSVTSRIRQQTYARLQVLRKKRSTL